MQCCPSVWFLGVTIENTASPSVSEPVSRITSCRPLGKVKWTRSFILIFRIWQMAANRNTACFLFSFDNCSDAFSIFLLITSSWASCVVGNRLSGWMMWLIRWWYKGTKDIQTNQLLFWTSYSIRNIFLILSIRQILKDVIDGSLPYFIFEDIILRGVYLNRIIVGTGKGRDDVYDASQFNIIGEIWY